MASVWTPNRCYRWRVTWDLGSAVVFHWNASSLWSFLSLCSGWLPIPLSDQSVCEIEIFFSFALLITQFKGRCSGLKYFITYLIESLWGFTFLFESVVCIVDTKCVHSSNLTSSLLNLVFVSIYGGICLLYSDVHALWYVWKEAVALYLLGALILVLICWNS